MDIDRISALLNLHGTWRASIFLQIMRYLFTLWSRPGVLTDPPTVHALTAKTMEVMETAIEQIRQVENTAFRQIAEEMGVDYDDFEAATEHYYPRNANARDVYTRFIEEYRWHAYGKQNDPNYKPPTVTLPDLDLEGSDWDFLEGEDLSALGGQGVDDATLTIPDIEFSAEILAELEADNDYEFDRAAFVKAWERLETIVNDDLQTAARDENHQLMQKKDIWIGYRRVIHPERSRTGSCGLCVVAATQVYQKKNLADIHNKCECTQIPVSAELDPGKQLNRNDIDGIFAGGIDGDEVVRLEFSREDLERIYAAAGGSTLADALRETRVHRGEHGELGPVISWSEPRDNPHYVKYEPPSLEKSRAMWQETIEWATEERARLQALVRRGRNGPAAAPYSTSLTYYEDLIGRMEANLADRTP